MIKVIGVSESMLIGHLKLLEVRSGALSSPHPADG